ncbi:hypothetical protein [Levilactobacillus wangkuiensis]|uniref:hypothetical protein n=1 Tax=Levilactobacillus wangkuiensis TaxID=2799566 RepID=UPI00194E0FB6|nr:hypothetical protein [Levilactobacillus wangkuiensis]
MANEIQQQFNQNQIMSGNPVPEGAAAVTNTSREMEEVKGQIFMAKQFPRNTFQAQKRIEDACKRKSLAMTATYSYPKGGQNVTGPSIRLAEVLAQNWGNIAFGFKELDQTEDSSTAMAYAWDVETNTRQERIFQVPHAIHTRKGMKVLSDPRDIYELVANQASRRVRACILSIIPGDVTEDAVRECNKTLAGDNTEPLKNRLAHAFNGFKENYDVTQNQIETYFGYAASEFSENNYVELVSIANSLNEKASKVSDWFPEPTEPDAGSDSKPKITKDFGKDKKPAAKASDKKAVKNSDSSQGNTGSKEPDKANQGELL